MSKRERRKHHKKNPITYYKCKNPGHTKTYCFQIKKKRRASKRAMKVTWDEALSSESDSSIKWDDGVINLYLIGIEDDEDG